MVSAVLLPNAKACFITSAGAPAVGYKVYTYDAGTLVPRVTYKDAAGAANNTNPIILDARGEAVIYWDGSYKVILNDAADVLVWSVDNVSQGPLSTPTPWVAAGGSADAITATYSPAVTALTDGLLLAFRSSAANATATPTFSPNGLTARTIVKAGGQALLAGDIARANYECLVRYNLANTRWELLDPQQQNSLLNSHGNAYVTPGMPADITLAAIAGANRYRVSVTFFGNLNNTNASPITPRITIAVKDGVTTLASREWTIGVAAAFNDRIAFTHVFEVAHPAAGAFTINITDTEADGGAHTWTICNSSASANIA